MNNQLSIIPNTNPNLVSIEIQQFNSILAEGGVIIRDQRGNVQPFQLFKAPVIAWGVSSGIYKSKYSTAAFPITYAGWLSSEDNFVVQDIVTGVWHGQVYFEQSFGKNDADLCWFLAEMAHVKYMDIKSKAA